jgi:myo-inositol 2-dehydrogenase / D-chiro-inositol 1-dehydrogenase
MAPSKQDVKISIAVAGLGRMGKRHVRTLLNRVSAAQVVAVCSTEPSELEWARNEYKDWGIEVYDSYHQMIQHAGLQAVWVSTSTDVHASQTIAAIEKGLNVLCEKPLSADMEEVRERLSPLIDSPRQDKKLIFSQVHVGQARCRNCEQEPPSQSHGRLLSKI